MKQEIIQSGEQIPGGTDGYEYFCSSVNDGYKFRVCTADHGEPIAKSRRLFMDCYKLPDRWLSFGLPAYSVLEEETSELHPRSLLIYSPQ